METYLFIINNAPYGDERPYNALRLAMNLPNAKIPRSKYFSPRMGWLALAKAKRRRMAITTSSG